MYPKWMQEMLYCNPCTGCRIRLDAQNVQAVGIRQPEEFEAWKAEPVFFVSLACPYCGQVVNLLSRQPLTKSLDGIEAFGRVVEQQCQGKEPPLEIPGFTTPTSPPTPTAPADGDTDQLRPSRRSNQPVTPPTQAEIRAFLNRLRKTSFKRGSKGFKTWMKDIGADAENPADDGGGGHADQ
jgi:hypothetical protein